MLEACPLACDWCDEAESASRSRTQQLLAGTADAGSNRLHAAMDAKKDRDCADRHVQCGEWVARGECTRSAAQMRRACARSCGLCGSSATLGAAAVHKSGGSDDSGGGGGSSAPCADLNAQCAGWAEVGECVRNAKPMERSCPLSCGSALGCSRSHYPSTTAPTWCITSHSM